MNVFYKSLPYEAKSPNFVVRLAAKGRGMSFFTKAYRKMMSEFLVAEQ